MKKRIPRARRLDPTKEVAVKSFHEEKVSIINYAPRLISTTCDLIQFLSPAFRAAWNDMTDRLPAVISPNTITTSQHTPDVVPALIAAAGERASLRFLEFFAATIRNPHTRRAYGRAVAGFMTWCDANRVGSITAVPGLMAGRPPRFETVSRTLSGKELEKPGRNFESGPCAEADTPSRQLSIRATRIAIHNGLYGLKTIGGFCENCC
jgi:hypothetical protein